MLATTEAPTRTQRRCVFCANTLPSSRPHANYCGKFCLEKANEQARETGVPAEPEFRMRRKQKPPKVATEKPRVEWRPGLGKNPNPKPMLSTGVSGSCGELIVATDLMRRGYEVFRALSPTCSCDLVALKDGRSYRVEVRSSQTVQPRPKHTDEGRFDIFATCTGPALSVQYSVPVAGYIQ